MPNPSIAPYKGDGGNGGSGSGGYGGGYGGGYAVSMLRPLMIMVQVRIAVPTLRRLDCPMMTMDASTGDAGSKWQMACRKKSRMFGSVMSSSLIRALEPLCSLFSPTNKFVQLPGGLRLTHMHPIYCTNRKDWIFPCDHADAKPIELDQPIDMFLSSWKMV